MFMQRRGFLDNMQKTLNSKMSSQAGASSSPEQLFMHELDKLAKT
jgi:hypothetical protein